MCLCSFCKPARFLFKQLCRIQSFKLFSRSLSALSSVLRLGCPPRASLRAPCCMRAGLPPACFLLQGCSWWGRGKEAAPSLPPFLRRRAARSSPQVGSGCGRAFPSRPRRAHGAEGPCPTRCWDSQLSINPTFPPTFKSRFFLLYFFPPFSSRRCVRRSRCPPGSSH